MKNSAQQILLVGGKSNGLRFVADSLAIQSGSITCYHRPNIVIGIPVGMAPNVIKETYRIISLAPNIFIGIFESMTDEDGITKLIKHYPKMKKINPYALPRRRKKKNQIPLAWPNPSTTAAAVPYSFPPTMIQVPIGPVSTVTTAHLNLTTIP